MLLTSTLWIAACALAAPPVTTIGMTVGAGVGDREPSAFELGRDELREARPEVRRRGVKRLAEVATRPAWELVLEALEDSDPQVADEAQLQLAGVADEAILRALYGRAGLRARDEWVRLRVAEAFGRMAIDVDGEALVEALSRRDAEASRAILWSIERAARSGRLAGDRARVAQALAREVEGRGDGAVRGAALRALAELDGERAAALARVLATDREVGPRRAALDVLVQHDRVACAALATRLLADEATGVRAAAIDALAVLGTHEACGALIEHLAREPRERLRWRLVDALQRLSGMKYRLDPRPWRLWLERLDPGWTSVLQASREVGEVVELGDSTRAFAGLPMLSDRVAFLIDFSGSLWQGKVDGRTRKEVAVEALSKGLGSLAPDAAFNVIPYTNEPLPWADALRPARPSEVRDAVAALAGCNASGRGNVFDAILVALTDPSLDTIVIYTDGVPTGGRRWNLDLMVELLLELDRHRGVAFDVVLIEAKGGTAKRWERLARATGGRCVAGQ